mgnify:CR=1 FL=1
MHKLTDQIVKGNKVRITNPKHKWYQTEGTVSKMDRGNVWVILKVGGSLNQSEPTICTRSASLTKITSWLEC